MNTNTNTNANTNTNEQQKVRIGIKPYLKWQESKNRKSVKEHPWINDYDIVDGQDGTNLYVTMTPYSILAIKDFIPNKNKCNGSHITKLYNNFTLNCYKKVITLNNDMIKLLMNTKAKFIVFFVEWIDKPVCINRKILQMNLAVLKNNSETITMYIDPKYHNCFKFNNDKEESVIIAGVKANHLDNDYFLKLTVKDDKLEIKNND